jgi:DNA polymerase-1
VSWGANRQHKFLRLPNETLFTYNLWDCHETARLFFALRRELQDRKLGPDQRQWRYFQEWVQPLQSSVVSMQKRGLLLDKDALRTYRTNLNRTLREVDGEIKAFATEAGFEFTDKFPNSDPQVSRLLGDHLGLRGGIRTPETRRLSVNQKSLMSLLKQLRKRDEAARPLLHNLFHRSRLQTLKERYLNLPVDKDGRVRATVKITGTKTFRYAYADPALQQFPKEIRHFFRAPSGGLFVAVDYSQLEARILAHMSGDERSLLAFQSGTDIHISNTLDLFAWSRETWEAMDASVRNAARGRGKGFLYETTYGGSGDSATGKEFCPCHRCVDLVPQTYDLNRSEMKLAVERWYEAHPAVRRFQSDLLESAKRRRYYDSPFGVRRWLTDCWGAELERQTKNLPMQMNGALLMNRNQVRLDRVGAPIIMQHHDSFLFELAPAPPRVWEQQIADYRGIMEEPVPELGAQFPVDVEVGETWGTLEKHPNAAAVQAPSEQAPSAP